MRLHAWIIGIVAALAAAGAGAQTDIAKLVEPIREVGPKGQGQQAAADAWKQLAKADVAQLPAVLEGMDGANALARNWLRAAADTIASRALDRGGKLPAAGLEKFLADTTHSPFARVTAFELLKRVDPQVESRLLPGMLDDPSMELRYDAVRMAQAKADAQLEAGDKPAARAAYGRAFTAARELKQTKSIAAKLADLGEQTDLPSHFGFVLRWRLVGPFDNRDKSGFDVAYGPEADPAQQQYAGNDGEVKWVEHTTKDELGMVDLNQALGKHKGAICYAYTEFLAPEARPCELRLGCVNANKVWLNGQLLTSNHIYHSGRLMDQYRGQGQLRKGRNQILVKIAQNEQDDPWAQDWQFQLRVCDHLGTGLLSQDRPNVRAAARPKDLR